MAVSVHFSLYFQTLSFFMIPRFSCSCNAKCPAMRAFPHSRAASFFIIRVCSGPLIFQRCLHLSTDLEQIGPGLLGAPQDGLHLFPLLRGQGLVLGQQVGVALNDGQRRFELMGKLDDLLPLLLLQDPLLLQAAGQCIAHGLQCLQSALVLPHLRAGKHRAVQFLPCHRLRGGGQLFGLPGQETPGPVGAPHHRAYQQQNAQNAVHRLHIRQHAPQRRVGVGHGIVKLQQANRSVLQF